MRRMAFCVSVILMLSAFTAHGVATISWYTEPPGELRQSDNSTLIVGNHTDPTLGGFLQLLFVGADGIDTLDYTDWDTPTGLLSSGNDEVIGTWYVGGGVLGFLSPDGAFDAGTSAHEKPIGSQFTVRFFEMPSPNFGTGLVPTSGNYGYSQIFSSTADPVNSGFESFEIHAPLFANLGPIPEPGTVALFGIGAVVLALRKRLKK